MKVDILAIGIHPDDVELSCSGTLMKHMAMGKKAAILDLTLGELGTRGSPELRTKEAMAAAKIQGISFRKQLQLKDGFFENNEASQRAIIEVIRDCQPDIVLCNAISDRHPDHGRAAQLAADACFLSGLVKIETHMDEKKQEVWRPKAVYHYIQDNFMKPDLVIDVTDHYEKKKEAILAFSSQFYDPNSKEPETPISTKHFMEAVDAKMILFGRSIGVRYAEGFVASRYIGVKNLFDLL